MPWINKMQRMNELKNQEAVQEIILPTSTKNTKYSEPARNRFKETIPQLNHRLNFHSF